ncbi:hypothetical protein [Aquisphaera insulae]|uniref:hypothetical protein n=1 Tax=Aquisphaera insulae TaxID=2712864 RepID=UPI0013ED30E4|nr:hypothetical protein [Aquisphaera insulae]
MKSRPSWVPVAFPAALAAGLVGLAGSAATGEDVPVTISGGHEIGRDDYGRPCVLMAAALGVKTDVFRKAFSGVTPARGRGPTGGEARRNKDALLRVLGPQGVTNERMDEVADYYRFRPQDGEIWKHRDARAHAVVEDGKVARIVVDDPGAGYTTPPKVAVEGLRPADLVVELHFGKDLKTNGSIRSIEIRRE